MARFREKRKQKKAKSQKAINQAGGIIFANPKDLRTRDKIKRKKGFRPLIILKPVMRKRLNKAGVKLRDDKDVVELGYKFKKHILDKKPYDIKTDRFLTPLKNFEEAQNEYLPEIEIVQVENFVDDAVSVAKDFTPIIKQIIQGILNFFKKIKEREKRGEATAEEKSEIAEIESEENEKEAKKELREDENMMGKIFNIKNLLILVAVSVLAYVAFKPKEKK